MKKVVLTIQALALFKLAQNHLYDIRVAVGPSMLPTINEAGDVLLVDRLTPHLRGYRKGDIVLTKSPLNPQTHLCKRVIAQPGESAFVDGVHYLVPQGYMWVEGDNKDHSLDSRTFGPIPEGLALGIVRVKLWPPGANMLLSQSS
jgi:inner membrane protease subunit 1